MATKKLNRQTGRTFRKLLNAIKMASESKDVLFVCINQHEMERLIRLVGKMCETYGLGDYVQINLTAYNVRFGKYGWIQFISSVDTKVETKVRQHSYSHMTNKIIVWDKD